MSNHYHLLIETPDANLFKGMRQLNEVYTQHFNCTHGRVGHLFQGRFRGILVEKEPHLLKLARYTLLNPVRAGMVRSPGEWPWSSYRATAAEEKLPAFVTTDWLLRAFADDRARAVGANRRYVAAGMDAPSPWLGLKNQIYLGSDRFVERALAMIDPRQPLTEIPQHQRRPQAKALHYYAERWEERDRAICEAYRSGAYRMQAIAEHLGVGRMTVSRAVNPYGVETKTA